jgi:hypothetical protein
MWYWYGLCTLCCFENRRFSGIDRVRDVSLRFYPPPLQKRSRKTLAKLDIDWTEKG